MKKLVLASQSPRRSEILKNAGYQFVSYPVYVSEIPSENLSLNEQILDIARRKAVAAADKIKSENPEHANSVVLSADTLVCYLDQTLGKPENTTMAYDYLKMLSGKTHQVKTAICLLDLSTNEELSHIETTSVEFHELSDQEILDYIETKEPMDKAGAYGIQGLGRKLVKNFSGDFDNVVGLPLHALENLFRLKQWVFLKNHL